MVAGENVDDSMARPAIAMRGNIREPDSPVPVEFLQDAMKNEMTIGRNSFFKCMGLKILAIKITVCRMSPASGLSQMCQKTAARPLLMRLPMLSLEALKCACMKLKRNSHIFVEITNKLVFRGARDRFFAACQSIASQVF